jgi:glycosyltransferase involved in cell wall biosynthesis
VGAGAVKVTILMPCLNEAETLGTCIGKAKGWLARSGVVGEVLIADNGSTDGSQQIATDLGARVVDVPERGYGSALFHGSQAARSEYVIMGDADDSYDFSKLDAFVDKLDEGYDLVMGNRFQGGIAPGAMPRKNRHVGNPVLSGIGRLLFRIKVGDFHCGLRAYRRDIVDRLDLRTTGMEYASEMVIKATLMGLKVTEVPTTLDPDGRSRPPHLRPWRDGWRHLRFMFLFSPRWLLFVPGMIVFVPSLAAYLTLLATPVTIGDVTFDTHTLYLVQAGMTIGFATVALAIILRLFASREGLLKEQAFLERLRNSPLLELGMTAGILMFAGGLFAGGRMVAWWGERDFGDIETGSLLRWLSGSTALLTLGGLVCIYSLILGFLALPTRRER